MVAPAPLEPDPQSRDDDHLPRPHWHNLAPFFRAHAVLSPNAILLESAKRDADSDRSLLFLQPRHELIARTGNDLDPLLRDIDKHVSEGAFVAGFFGYECGEHLLGIAPNPAPRSPGEEPLAWLAVYESPIIFEHSTGIVHGSLPPLLANSPALEVPPLLDGEDIQIHPDDYLHEIARIQDYLHSGDTYQVNFTDRICGTTASSLLSIYNHLLGQQPVPYAAILNLPFGPILSFSPELFFRTSQGQITVRPMKGTWPRGRTLAEDREQARRLTQDEKNRSEHVMIVDLLRNDLGRICEFGSVKPDKLFQTERYQTLLQMTSTISGRLAPQLTPSAIFKALFPSGSITGAPKKRTMEIIRELESGPRGVYTGSVGYFGPRGESCFNVAIRTMRFNGQNFRFGVGGAITAGSNAAEEFEECRLKAAFLTRRTPPFSLIETMRASGSIPLLDRHLKRLADSAEYFGIPYDAKRLEKELAAVARTCPFTPARVRVELNQAGSWQISTAPLNPPRWLGRLVVANKPVSSNDVFRFHKTTNREVFEQEFKSARAAGYDEVLFLNKFAAVTEGAISNIFLRINEQWITPALTCGLLPGVYRSTLLCCLERVAECEVPKDVLRTATQIIVCNALQGVRPVKQIEASGGDVIWASANAREEDDDFSALLAEKSILTSAME